MIQIGRMWVLNNVGRIRFMLMQFRHVAVSLLLKKKKKISEIKWVFEAQKRL